MASSGWRQVRAELRKAASPLLLIALLVFGLSVWRDLENTTWHFASQSRDSSGDALWFADRADDQCANVDASEVHCALARRDLEYNQPLFSNAGAMGEVAAAMEHPLAVAQFVERQAIAGFGWLLVALVAMLLVAGERSAGTADEALRRLGRGRFLAIKWAAVVIAVFGILLATAVILVALRSTYVESVTAFTTLDAKGRPSGEVLVPANASWTSWRSALTTGAGTALVVAVVAAVVVPIAARCRTMHWFGIGSLAAVSVVLAISRLSDGGSYAPMTVIDRALRLSDVPPLMRDVRIWDLSSRSTDVDRLAITHEGSWLAMLGLVVVAIAIAAAFTWDFVQRGHRQ